MSWKDSLLSPAERFWPQVEKGPRCWYWTGRKNKLGYGNIKYRNGTLAHRLSWMLNRGPIPAGMCVLHHCDTPQCVRPEHLFIGSPADNARDRDSKDRHQRGERSPRAKLTDKKVVEIRRVYKAGGETTRSLGKKYGVSGNVICQIVNRRYWKHI